MNNITTGLSALTMLFSFGFFLVVAVLGFLLPLFIFRIRNEIILMNEKMAQVVSLLGGKTNDAEFMLKVSERKLLRQKLGGGVHGERAQN